MKKNNKDQDLSLHKDPFVISEKTIKSDQKNLLVWYNLNKRALPWRSNKNPYLIWISEVMLQQTTVTAVIPYYSKFVTRFPTVESLAAASIENIYEFWAGLGYYSRARNLHKAAKILVSNYKGIFPKEYLELIELPGFGPYTSRAVSSLAFDQTVGVLDGNVIRILSRKYGLDSSWWETTERNKLQLISDQLANTSHAADLNQAMMELGATICTPKKVMCIMCPWKKTCVSLATDKINQRPLSKPRPEFELWSWDFDILLNKSKTKIFLTENTATPFLKNNWLPLSTGKKITKKPTNFDFKHGVTKYEIFVSLNKKEKILNSKKGRWVDLNKISEINPTSLIKKIIKVIE